VEGRDVFITASVGARFIRRTPRIRNPDEKRRARDVQAKEAGRNTHQLYTLEMQTRVTERLALESRLRQALARGEFSLHYQPQVDLRSSRVFDARR